MNKVWHKYSWLFHIVTAVLTIGIIWGSQDTTVNAQGISITELQIKYGQMADKIAGIKEDTASIKESIKWIEKALK